MCIQTEILKIDNLSRIKIYFYKQFVDWAIFKSGSTRGDSQMI